jgi:hypothetical protein
MISVLDLFTMGIGPSAVAVNGVPAGERSSDV